MQGTEFQTWRDFFDWHAPHYRENVFTQNTQVEVQFMIEVMGLQPGHKVLDMGCGIGRHSIELAKRGMECTGVDFSGQMLFEAERDAKQAGVNVRFIQADATEWSSEEEFDAAICVCEGGLGLIGHDEDPLTHDLSILKNIGASLKPGAPFLLTALNAYSFIRRVADEQVDQGAFDPATMIARYADTLELPTGQHTIYIKERLFIPPELTAMLHHAGFAVQNVWGGTAGEWGKRSLRLDEIEVMLFSFKR